MNRKARRAARSGTGRVATTVPTADAGRISALINATAQVDRGNRNRQDGKLMEALECYLRAIDMVPDFTDAHINFCAVLIALSRFADAAKHCQHILAHDPRIVAGHIQLGVARIGMNDAKGAFAAAKSALRLSETPEARMLFAQCLQMLPSLPDTDDQTRGWVTRAITEPWGRASEFARHAIDIVKTDRDIAGCIARAVAAWPQILPAGELYGAAGFSALSSDTLLHAVLENTRLADLEIERFLTAARRNLLETAAKPAPASDGLEFYCALARQCFINEYVYALADADRVQVEALRNSLNTALAGDAAIPAIWLAAVAAYRPLYDQPDGERLLQRSWPARVDDLLTQQIREPASEAELRSRIPTLTAVDDEISLLVQQQYEQNPYPRWVKVASSSTPSDINAQLHRQFPHSAFRTIGHNGAVDILVAGCGTGQQLIDVAIRFTGARVLAIDLSLPSLCYAKRKTDALGLRNIEYGRADILGMKDIGRNFDVIDSSGVLHHLADPIAGWNVLLSLLRRDGVMRIALYSELARQHVVAARHFVAERGYRDGPDDIRRFRQDVLALPDRDTVRLVAKSGDFFSISDCRDLVFHVQEHRFTLPQIKAQLAASGLNFLGFDIPQNILNQYRARCPDDPAAVDLDRWHAFETANPWTFGGMYQLWLQRRADG